MSESLPIWVWELLADLIDEDDEHPRLFHQPAGSTGYEQYPWCPKVTLDKQVPPETLSVAKHIAHYRRYAKEAATT